MATEQNSTGAPGEPNTGASFKWAVIDGQGVILDEDDCAVGSMREPYGPQMVRAFNCFEDMLAEHDVRVGDLIMLRKAIEAGDPKRELLVRIDDMLRETRAVIAKAEAN